MSTIAVKNFTSTQANENMEFSPSGTANMIVTANGQFVDATQAQGSVSEIFYSDCAHR